MEIQPGHGLLEVLLDQIVLRLDVKTWRSIKVGVLVILLIRYQRYVKHQDAMDQFLSTVCVDVVTNGHRKAVLHLDSADQTALDMWSLADTLTSTLEDAEVKLEDCIA